MTVLIHQRGSDLLKAILRHYEYGTLVQQMPYFREDIERLTDGSALEGREFNDTVRTA
ncbi:hypothetical protein LLE49_27160 [Alicyclobacillus tolerans]|uniref:hypothetical protein n=1 Tax=Alicyclobacillus tolerans TaxID=90970 RepID=UPI001F2A5EEB|nr:hypothetical protein [Alicyclobacillus tolerans]MCF8568402.1 hypothetical protein [Alicyclobacillus tolerans]